MQGLSSYNFPLTSLSLSIIPFFVILSFLSDRMKIISKVRFCLARAFSPRRCMYLLNLLYLTVTSPRKTVGKLKPHRDGAYIYFGPFSATDSLLKEWIYLSPDCSFYWSWMWKWSRSVMSNSLWPHELEPARLLCPWNSPGKNTGVGSCSLL